MAPRWPGVLAEWSISPWTGLPLVAAALVYGQACARVRAAHPRHPVPAGRRWAFFGGLAVAAVALLSPVDTYADELFSVHMVQHVLLTFVAAPLVLLGHPVGVALGAASPAHRRRLLRVLRGRVVAVVGHPVVAWLTFTGVMWAVHFSPLFEAALEATGVHALEHFVFVGAALLFWWPVVGEIAGASQLRHPLRLLYLALAMPQNTFLALAILSSGEVLYRHYADSVRSWGPSALADQRQAGGIMWVAGDLTLLVAVLFTAAAWARHEEAATRRAERRQDALSEAADRPPSPRTAG